MADNLDALTFGTQELPYNLEAEQSILGAVLLDSSVVARVLEYIKPECFYRQQHQEIFSYAADVLAGSILDYVTGY